MNYNNMCISFGRWPIVGLYYAYKEYQMQCFMVGINIAVLVIVGDVALKISEFQHGAISSGFVNEAAEI